MATECDSKPLVGASDLTVLLHRKACSQSIYYLPCMVFLVIEEIAARGWLSSNLKKPKTLCSSYQAYKERAKNCVKTHTSTPYAYIQ